MDKEKSLNAQKNRIQVKSEISVSETERMDGIIKKYKFRSRYQLLQYLIKCFLKVADPRDDEIVNKDIENMFDGFETASKDDFQNTKRGGAI